MFQKKGLGMCSFEKDLKCSRELEIISWNQFWRSVLCWASTTASMVMVVSCAGSSPTGQPSAKSLVESQNLNSAKTEQVEVEFVSLVSKATGTPGDDFKASNMYSIASGQDPYSNNLPVGTTITLNNWEYLRDPQKTISMSLELKAFERAKDVVPRNRWWAAGTHPKVEKHTGQWAVGDTFCKYAKDGLGEQWCFNYKVIKVVSAQ